VSEIEVVMKVVNAVVTVAKMVMVYMEQKMKMVWVMLVSAGVSISDSVDNSESSVFNSVSVNLRTESLLGVYIDVEVVGLLIVMVAGFEP